MTLQAVKERTATELTVVYVAVGVKDTKLYRFDLVDGTFAIVRNQAHQEFVYGPGFDSMDYRPKDGKLYAMRNDSPAKRDTLVVIDPVACTFQEYQVPGVVKSKGSWFLGVFAPDGDTFVVAAGPSDPVCLIDVAATPPMLKDTQKPTGPGRFDDWSYHPKDKRLYAVEGDNGDLLFMNPASSQQKVVLKKGAFPKAEASTAPGSSGRKAYAATFFDTNGTLYVLDSRGNVYSVDLTKSTAADPVKGSAVRRHVRVGGGRAAIGGLEVRDSSSRVRKLNLDPWYVEIKSKYKDAANWAEGKGHMYSYDVEIQDPRADLPKFRIVFDAAAGDKVIASGVRVTQANGKAFIRPLNDQLLPKGQWRAIRVQVWVRGENQPTKRPLTGLKAYRE